MQGFLGGHERTGEGLGWRLLHLLSISAGGVGGMECLRVTLVGREHAEGP